LGFSGEDDERLRFSRSKGGRAGHLVVIRDAVNLARLKLHKHHMMVLERMKVGGRTTRPSLIILATHEARIHIEMRVGDRANLFKVKVQHVPVDAVHCVLEEQRSG
jgi:hypothetical protein